MWRGWHACTFHHGSVSFEGTWKVNNSPKRHETLLVSFFNVCGCVNQQACDRDSRTIIFPRKETRDRNHAFLDKGDIKRTSGVQRVSLGFCLPPSDRHDFLSCSLSCCQLDCVVRRPACLRCTSLSRLKRKLVLLFLTSSGKSLLRTMNLLSIKRGRPKIKDDLSSSKSKGERNLMLNYLVCVPFYTEFAERPSMGCPASSEVL